MAKLIHPLKRFTVRFSFLVAALLLFGSAANAQQSFNDSIMSARVTDSIFGKPTVHYTPGSKERALKYQQLFARATKFYERLYHTPFRYTMAVLDSSQWVREKLPFGFLGYDSGWVFIPAKVSESFFLEIYGINEKKSDLQRLLVKDHSSIAQLSDAIYYIYSLHELGHYFTDDNQRLLIPGNFANELIATYFSYCYFKSTNNPGLQQLLAFCSWLKTNYHPKYRNIAFMDTLYTGMDMQNFKWFHCNIVLLCQQIYARYGLDFINYYITTFRHGVPADLSTQQVIDLLDKKCKGLVNAWAKQMEKGK